jgi:ABC-type transport system substrate-binding protein
VAYKLEEVGLKSSWWDDQIGFDVSFFHMMVSTPAAASRPQSMPEAETVRVMIAEIGLALTDVNVRASSNSTQENMKQKKAATPMPLAISGTRILMKKRGNE